MTIAHEQIAAMTYGEVNKEIAKRLDQYEEWDSMGSDNMDCPDVFEEYPDYCGDWSHAGRLLEMMKVDKPFLQVPDSDDRQWFCVVFIGTNNKTTIGFLAPTATEAIARCWLEWWEVTKFVDEKKEVKDE